eukprot:PhF_6_TR43512/c0_g1_i1/m.66796
MGGEISRIVPPSKAPKSIHQDSASDMTASLSRRPSFVHSSSSSPALAPLFLGSMQCLFNHENVFPAFHVRALVSCMPLEPDSIATILPLYGISKENDYMLVSLEDSSGDQFEHLLPKIPSVVHFIHEKRKEGKAVLVHCDGGITRSASVVTAYLMKYGPMLHANDNESHMPLDVARSYVKQSRPKINIRLFEPELRTYGSRFDSHPSSQTSSRCHTPNGFMERRLSFARPLILPVFGSSGHVHTGGGPGGDTIADGCDTDSNPDQHCVGLMSASFVPTLGALPLPIGLAKMFENTNIHKFAKRVEEIGSQREDCIEFMNVWGSYVAEKQEGILRNVLEYSATEPTPEELRQLCSLYDDRMKESHFDALAQVIVLTLSELYIPWNDETEDQWTCAISLLFSDVLQFNEIGKT